VSKRHRQPGPARRTCKTTASWRPHSGPIACSHLRFSAFLSHALLKRLGQPPVSRATPSEFNVHAVVRLRHNSPHGKSIESRPSRCHTRTHGIKPRSIDGSACDSSVSIGLIRSQYCVQFGRALQPATKHSPPNQAAAQRMRFFNPPKSLTCEQHV